MPIEILQLHASREAPHTLSPALHGCRRQPSQQHQHSLHHSQRKCRRPAASCVSGWTIALASATIRCATAADSNAAGIGGCCVAWYVCRHATGTMVNVDKDQTSLTCIAGCPVRLRSHGRVRTHIYFTASRGSQSTVRRCNGRAVCWHAAGDPPPPTGARVQGDRSVLRSCSSTGVSTVRRCLQYNAVALPSISSQYAYSFCAAILYIYNCCRAEAAGSRVRACGQSLALPHHRGCQGALQGGVSAPERHRQSQ